MILISTNFFNLPVYAQTTTPTFDEGTTTTTIDPTTSTTTSSSTLTLEEYNALVEEGVYGPDVTYEDAQYLTQQPISSDSDQPQYQIAPDTGSYIMTVGDIFITSSTSSFGFTGHAGIVTPDKYILHFPSNTEPIKKYTLNQWFNRYPNTEIRRVPNTLVANQAAAWASANYWLQNQTPKYYIDQTYYKTNPSYCSKIVWQAYYYGAGSTPVANRSFSDYYIPYDLPSYFNSAYYPKHIYGPILAH